MNKKFLWALSIGHSCTDMTQGALPAILPYLVLAGGLGYAQAAGLTFAVSLFASALQPFFGILADRTTKTRIMPAGILLGGLGLSFIGFFPNNYWLMFTVAVISGIGVAAFHPEAARMANKVSGKRKGGNMSIFSVGGNFGFTLGPILATPALIYFGLRGSALLAIPAIIMFFIFLRIGPKMRDFSNLPEEGGINKQGEMKNEWGKFLLLSTVIVARSIISHNTNTFLPLYWTTVLNQSKAEAGLALSLFFCCGAVATIIGGHLADRIGINNIIKVGWILLIPTLFFLTKITNPVGMWLILIPLSFGLNLTNTPMILLGQKYLPVNIGFASGITMGLGNSIGGITAPILGKYADLNGLTLTLNLLCILPLIGTVLTFAMKPPRQ